MITRFLGMRSGGGRIWSYARSEGILVSVTGTSHADENPRTAQNRRWARSALQCWDLFPVARQPRPLVLTGPVTRFERGFRSGQAKLAFHYGQIEADVPLPPGMLEMLRGSGAGPKAMREERRRPKPLRITQARPARAEFATDRGKREFPAWQLGGPDVDGAFWALDPAVAAERWEPPEPAAPKPFDGPPHRSASAVIEDDNLTVHFTFTGSPAGITEYPAAEVVETVQALVILPTERDIGPPGFRECSGQARAVTARLARPLSGRVLVDLDASPLTVTTYKTA